MKTNISFNVELPDEWDFDNELDFRYLVQTYARHLLLDGFNFREELLKINDN